jgi:hypothetical protein
MSWVDFDTEIEDQIETVLSATNSVFEVNRYFETTSPDDLLHFILSKVKSKPAVFLRSTGVQADNLNTNGTLTNGTFDVQIIFAANDGGKMKQIKGEKRSVNILVGLAMNRLNNFELDLTGQPSQPLVFRSLRDLFVSDSIDVRMATFAVEGVTLNMDTL